MNQSVEALDRLVEDYLAAVDHACTGLPGAQRVRLVADLREHITVMRSRLPQPTEADIRTILDRLGEPSEIAAEARLDAPIGSAVAPPKPAVAPVPQLTRTTSPVTVAVVLGLALLLIAIVLGGLLVLLRAGPAVA